MAAPHPGKELIRLDKLLKKQLPAVLLVTGVSDWFRTQAVERALAAVPDDAELRVIDGADSRASDADSADASGAAELQELRGGGLFAKTAFVVVRRGANWWQQNGAAVADIVPKIQPGSGLIVESPKLDKRKKAVAALVKATIADGNLFEFRDLYDQPYDRSRSPLEGELCRWVVEQSQRLKVPLQPESAWLLVLQVGKVPAELLGELQRLRDQFAADADGGGREIAPLAPRELQGKLTVRFESTPFEFAEAVLSGDRQAAQRSLSAMFARGVRQQDGKTMDAGGLLPFTTSWLFRQFGTVYEGRVLLDSGVSLRDLPQRAGVRQFADRFVAQVRGNDQRRLRRGLSALHACQRKSRLTAEDPELLLEQFLAQWFDRAPVEGVEQFEW